MKKSRKIDKQSITTISPEESPRIVAKRKTNDELIAEAQARYDDAVSHAEKHLALAKARHDNPVSKLLDQGSGCDEAKADRGLAGAGVMAKHRASKANHQRHSPSQADLFSDLPVTQPRAAKACAGVTGSPIILASLQRRGDAPAIIYPEMPPIAAETPVEIMHRLNWAARDAAIRKRRAA
jgi:hypothetical protein